MKKALIFMLSAVLALFALSACGEDAGTVAVKNVGEIVSTGSVALVDRYAGIVVSGETAEVKKDEDKKVLEVRVSEGDMVSKGDVLFSYDTEAMQLQLEKLRLEYEEMQNKIISAEKSIPEIQNRMRWASAADQLGYNLQIQSLEADILESTYNMNIKDREISALQTAMENVDVCAPISGRIMSVKDESKSGDNPGGETYYGDQPGASGTNAFITITDVKTYRIKGTINEMNVGTLYEGMPVIIRSRVDGSRTWNGMLEKIDWETTVNDNSAMYYGYSDEMTSTTKYPFYVTIDGFEGLLLGQHIYIEPDYGQSGVKEGIWLPDYYIVHEGAETFVWAENSRGKIEKRSVSLGDTDPESGTVLVLSGLGRTDSIAFPEEGICPGMTCVPYADTMFVDGEAEYYPDSEYYPEAESGSFEGKELMTEYEDAGSENADMETDGHVELQYPEEELPSEEQTDGGVG